MIVKPAHSCAVPFPIATNDTLPEGLSAGVPAEAGNTAKFIAELVSQMKTPMEW